MQVKSCISFVKELIKKVDMNMLTIKQLLVLTDNYIYLIHDDVSGETAVIDPAEAKPVLDYLAEMNWQLTYILNTHHHLDHVGANVVLKQKTGCQIVAAEVDWDRIPGIDQGLKAGDVIALGAHPIQVFETHGHTNGHIVYYFTEDQAVFCGDTLFVMGCGRLFEGTPEEMYRSLQQLKELPADTRVYCAHEYTEANGRFALSIEPDNECLQEKMRIVAQLRAEQKSTVPSTIEQERVTNPFLRVDSLGVQKTLGLIGEPPVRVFTELRKRKDNW
jgi:hydroxyacylglutathione hydrolase